MKVLLAEVDCSPTAPSASASTAPRGGEAGHHVTVVAVHRLAPGRDSVEVTAGLPVPQVGGAKELRLRWRFLVTLLRAPRQPCHPCGAQQDEVPGRWRLRPTGRAGGRS